MYSLITLALSAIIICIFTYASNKKLINNLEIILKVMSVSLCIMGICRFFLSDSFVKNISDVKDPLQSFLRWGYHIGYAMIPMSVFFNSHLIRNITTCFSLPVTILAVIFFEDTMAYFTSAGAGGFYVDEWIRYATYILELTIALSTIILMEIHNKHVIDIKNVKEVLSTIGMVPLIMIQMMPSYIIRPFLSDFKLTVGMFGEFHLLWIFSLIIEIILLHYIFRNRSEKDKYMLLVFLVLAQIMHTNSQMLIGFTFSRIPLQLCNIAAFLYLYMIITKDKGIFDFCYLANLVGAAIAMILTNFDGETLCFWNIHYIYEHSFVVMVPILGVSLGIFPRLDKSALKNMTKYFSVYFVFILILGTILNSLNSKFGTVNHFYMFNPKVAVQYLPFAGFVNAVHWEFNGFEVYPILVITIFVLFITLNVLFYFITRGLYKLIDYFKERTQKQEPELSIE